MLSADCDSEDVAQVQLKRWFAVHAELTDLVKILPSAGISLVAISLEKDFPIVILREPG
jgi:hypothetical protein